MKLLPKIAKCPFCGGCPDDPPAHTPGCPFAAYLSTRAAADAAKEQDG